MRQELKESYKRLYGEEPISDIKLIEFGNNQISRYKIHGIAKAEWNFNPRVTTCEEWIIDAELLNKGSPDTSPKGAWFGNASNDLFFESPVSVLISSGKQQLPKDVSKFNLCKYLEGVLIAPHYKPNKVEFSITPIYGKLQE